MEHPEFRYFRDYHQNGVFVDDVCSICGSAPPCLDGTYFHGDVDYEAVCVQCLKSGAAPVDVPAYLERMLAKDIQDRNPGWSGAEVNASVVEAVGELSRTPPIPWIQNNYWVVCHGDFAKYVGEWTEERLNEEAGDGDGKSYLTSIVDPFPRQNIGDLDSLWQSIGGNATAVYVFECLTCQKRRAIVQSY